MADTLTSQRHGQKGFTLLEVLVVFSIITLMIAIMTPALKKAKSVTEDAICVSNLHQYGLSGLIYLMDFDEKFPDAGGWLYIPTTFYHYQGYNACQWHDDRLKPDGTIWPYFKNDKMHICPTYERLGNRFGPYHDMHDYYIPIDPQRGYSMNGFLGPRLYSNGEGQCIADGMAAIKNPSRVIFFCEENLWKIPGYSQVCLNDTIMLARQYPYTSNLYCDCIASFHRITGEDYNSGRSNMAFLDGSTGSGTPKQSFELANPIKTKDSYLTSVQPVLTIY